MVTFSGRYVKRPCYLWQGGSSGHRRAVAGRKGVARAGGGGHVPRLAQQPEHGPELRDRVGKTAERIGEARPLASVADDEIGEALELLWGTAAVNTWNSRRAGVLSWLGWCRDRGYEGPMVPAWAKRLTVPDSETLARSKMAIDRLIARREVHLREKTLWRMLYETCARSEEVLDVNIEDLDLAGRRCPVKAKGAVPKVRRRADGQRPSSRQRHDGGHRFPLAADNRAASRSDRRTSP